MQAETLTMSGKEQDRAEVIRQVIDGYIKQSTPLGSTIGFCMVAKAKHPC